MSISVSYIVKALALFLLILLLIFLLAVITPKLASKTDKLIDKFFRNRPREKDDSLYKVRGIYDLPEKDDAEEKNNEDGEIENGKK
ncbi:MAG: hypothetical protein ACI4JB_04150 [Porcipelethomonas sp.]